MKCPRCGEEMDKIGGRKLIAPFFLFAVIVTGRYQIKECQIDQALLREILEALLKYVYTELDFDRDEKEYFKYLLNRLKRQWPSED